MKPEIIARFVAFFGIAVVVPQLIGLAPRLVRRWRTDFYVALLSGLLAGCSFLAIGYTWLNLEVASLQRQPDVQVCGTFVGAMLVGLLYGTAFHIVVGSVLNVLLRYLAIRRGRLSADDMRG